MRGPALTTMPEAGRPRIIAHRGARRAAPEHTIAAFEAAVADGADALWLDVQPAADDALVVFHGTRLERTTDGRGLVRERGVRELKRLDAGRWFGRRFRGQRIQTLPEVIERFRARAGFVVALPAGSDVHPGIEERLLGLLALAQAPPDTAVASYDHHALARCRALDADVPLLACVGARLLAPGRLAPAGVLSGLCLDARWTLEADVQACRAAGLDCYVGVLADAAAAARVARWRPAALVVASGFAELRAATP